MSIDPRGLIRKLPGLAAAKGFIRDRLLSDFARRRRFVSIYATNYWRNGESRSGLGSSLAQTEAVRAALPTVCRELGVSSLLDVPCGDLNWIRHVELPGVKYIGADIVPALIASNVAQFGETGRTFMVLDLVKAVPPQVDLILCRDLLVHLSFADIARILSNIRRSDAKWLLTTSFQNRESNEKLGGDWRPLNLERPPFDFPPPRRVILENCTQDGGQYADKTLALWSIADLPSR
ncbi:MAG TPA: class I SAM-dependent methyltransferase [Rhizomicrobium sp.]|jgi:SAM-dependent methyltransferase